MTRLRAVLGRWAERLGIWPFRWLALAALWLLRRRYRDQPVPLGTVLRVRRLAAGRQPLVPRTWPRAPEVTDPGLRDLLAGRELGAWALGPKAIDRLAATFGAIRPAFVIEFGSGLSTVCLAYLARQQDRDDAPVVLSFDQDAGHTSATRSWLEQAGLERYATVMHAPLAWVDWDGRSVSTYQLPDGWDALAVDRQASLVIVDGPAAEKGARYATLPLVRGKVAPGARILLDDALRDGELDVARRWLERGWIADPGIVLTDKGLLLATAQR
jgi:predicted O-methyltransferase YrrM